MSRIVAASNKCSRRAESMLRRMALTSVSSAPRASRMKPLPAGRDRPLRAAAARRRPPRPEAMTDAARAARRPRPAALLRMLDSCRSRWGRSAPAVRPDGAMNRTSPADCPDSVVAEPRRSPPVISSCLRMRGACVMRQIAPPALRCAAGRLLFLGGAFPPRLHRRLRARFIMAALRRRAA